MSEIGPFDKAAVAAGRRLMDVPLDTLTAEPYNAARAALAAAYPVIRDDVIAEIVGRLRAEDAKGFGNDAAAWAADFIERGFRDA